MALFELVGRELGGGTERPASRFQTTVDMVELTFTVTDRGGKYVSGLGPSDIQVREDGVIQRIVAFAQGSRGTSEPHLIPALDDASVFVLFDTSNWMYSNFPYACDALAQFVRGLDDSDSVAVYKFSRNLFRAVPLTGDRRRAISGVRSAVAGDDTALFNAVLLTVRDAAATPGRKVLVVFSNGPDNASIVSPDDVGRIAQDAGVPIYLISTGDEQRNPASARLFRSLTERTGGRLFWAESWKKQSDAFMSIREDLASSYTIAYYPLASSNDGFRRISVDVISRQHETYTVRARAGYHARPNYKSVR